MKSFSNNARLILVVSWLVFCAQLGASQTVALLDEARVPGEVIRLSDLLPPDAPQEVWKACRVVELGRSPTLGSVRVLAQPQIVQHLAEAPDLLRQLAIPDRTTVRRTGYLIRQDAVRESISKFLLERGRSANLPSAAWQWPETMESLEKDPSLEVGESSWDGQRHRRQFVLRCVKRPACNPFVVYVPEPARSSDDPPLVNASRAIHLSRFETASESEAGPILTKAGQRATMLLEDGEIRISIQVICLQRGRLGQQIRVLDPVRRRVFRAKVLTSNLLRVAS